MAQLATIEPDPTPVLVVMEATGSYWVGLAVALYTAGYQVAVVNPAHLANFARSLPRRAKNRSTGCRHRLPICLRTHAPTWTPPPAVYHELRQRLVTRDALMEMRQQARNHYHALAQWPVQVASVMDQFAGGIADLDDRIAQVERELLAALHHGAWAASVALLDSIPGPGMTTMAWLLGLNARHPERLQRTPVLVYRHGSRADVDSSSTVRRGPFGTWRDPL